MINYRISAKAEFFFDLWLPYRLSDQEAVQAAQQTLEEWIGPDNVLVENVRGTPLAVVYLNQDEEGDFDLTVEDVYEEDHAQG